MWHLAGVGQSAEGPVDVPLGKDLRMGRMAKAGLSVMGSECLPFKCHIVSVFSATCNTTG